MTLNWVSINRFEDGKIVEAWLQGDIVGLLLQFGVLALPEMRAS